MRFALFCLIGLALSSRATAFEFQDLKNLISQKQPRSIEETVPLLPQELRSNLALMARSRSIQGASPDNPRAFLFNDSGSVVVSFNGSQAQRGGDHIEVVSFDEATARFKFSTITFDNGRARLNENVQNCFGCHGGIATDLHPVWDPGVVWRGAYGSQNDAFLDQANPAVADEARAYTSFLQTAKANPRYSSLDFSVKLGEGDPSKIENRPNLRLGLISMRQQAKRVARLFAEKSAAGDVRKTIGMLEGCQPVPNNSRLQTQVESGLANYLKVVFGATVGSALMVSESPSLMTVNQVAFALGIDVHEIPLTIERETYATFDSSFHFRDLLVAELIKRPGINRPVAIAERSLTESALGLKASSALTAIDRLGSPLLKSSAELCSEL